MARRGRFPTLKKAWVDKLVRSELNVLLALMGANAADIWTLEPSYLVAMLVKDFKASFREQDLSALLTNEDRFRPGVIQYLLELQRYMDKEIDDIPVFPGEDGPTLSPEELAQENIEAFGETLEPEPPTAHKKWVKPPGLAEAIEKKQEEKTEPPAAPKKRRYRGPLGLRKKSEVAAEPAPPPPAPKPAAVPDITQVELPQVSALFPPLIDKPAVKDPLPPPEPPKEKPAAKKPPKAAKPLKKPEPVAAKKAESPCSNELTLQEEVSIGTFLALHMLVEHSGIPTRVELATEYNLVREIAEKAKARLDASEKAP